MRTALLRSIGLFVLIFLPLGSASGQAEMPTDWQSLPADQFTDAAEALFAAEDKPTDETVKAVVEHAWNTFLTDGQQIATGDWGTIQVLSDLIVPRRGAMLAGLEGEAREAAAETLNAALSALHANLKARLQAEDALVAGVPMDDWQQRVGVMARTGMPHADRAELNQLWKSSNDWQSISVDELAWLTSSLNVDQVNPNQFSARWSGTITAPLTGSYTFEQLRQPLANGAMKLTIGGATVLDTTATLPAEEGEQPALTSKTDAEAFRSQPVNLTAGQTVPIEVEYVFDAATMMHDALYGPRNFGIATLLWESENLEKQFVPPSAYQTADGNPGIEGEYFRDTTFTESAGTRVEPALQLVFSGRTVLSQYTSDQQEIIDYLRPRLMQELTSAPAAEQAIQLGECCAHIVPRLTASERLRFVADLAGEPQLVEQMSAGAMAALMTHAFMLPTTDHLDLMAAWGETHDPPPCRPGKYPGWGGDYYRSRNYDPTATFVGVMWGDLWTNAEYMIENHLARADGSCNLAVVYALAIPARFQNRTTLLRQKLDEILSDDTLTGDERARWLLARKFVAEVCIDYAPGPNHGMEYLEEAVLVAEEPQLRYRLNIEHAAKLMSLDKEELANAALPRAAAVATTQEQQEEIASLREYASDLSAFYTQRRIDSPKAQRLAADRAYATEMRLSEQRAINAGNQAAADRYAARAASLEQIIAAQEEE